MTATAATVAAVAANANAATTHTVATVATAANVAASRQAAPRRDGDDGLIALEWLLIVAAVAGLAATTVLGVQRVVDDTAEVHVEPGVRYLDAEIAAAAVASEATAWRKGIDPADPRILNNFLFGSSSFDYATFEQRCQDLEAAFDDVVQGVQWRRPRELFEDEQFQLNQGYNTLDSDFIAGKFKAGARCEVTAHAGLGG